MTSSRVASRSFVCLLALLQWSCGGGVSAPSTPPAPTITLVTVATAGASLLTGRTLAVTATVLGTGNFDPAVTWAVNGIAGGDTTNGTISNGTYVAPSSVPSTNPVTVTATSVEDSTKSGSAEVTVIAPAKLDTISPDQGIVSQTVTLTLERLTNPMKVFFSLPNGNSVEANFTAVSATELTATVPVGTVSGPVYVQYMTLPDGGITVTNSVNFTRLPNLHIRAQSKELSSGETTQFQWSLLGGNSNSPIQWSADQGTISGGGLYTAPTVSAEKFATITGCIAGTQACDAVMVRVLPFRIDPPTPATALGDTLQLGAVQGGSLLSATWALPANNGQITTGGLFTAPANSTSAGYVPLTASFGGKTQNGSVAVTGGFPGMATRVWDYVNFNHPGNLGMYTESVAVSGNTAYCVDLGAPFGNLSYAAIDAYDITNPHEPVWVGAVDATSLEPLHIFTYGNYLITVDSGYAVPVPSRITIYDIQNQLPVLKSVVSIPDLAISTENNGIVYGFGHPAAAGSTTVPVYTFDVRSGSVIQHQYNLPPPVGDVGIITNGFESVTGSGNMIYASQGHPNGSVFGQAVDAFDISTSPPKLVSWIPTGDNGFQVRAVGQLVFADRGIYDFSTSPPTQVGNFSMISVRSVQGNQVLAFGEHYNYLVIDVSNPAAPTLKANIADASIENPESFPNGAIAGNNFFAADGLGGLAVFDISAPGGPVNEPPNPFYQVDNGQFTQIFDQAIQSSTLYAAGSDFNGGGGLVTFDTSGSQPVPSGRLTYANEYGLAIAVSGTYAFLGLNDKLKVVDVSNVSSPTEVASVGLPTTALALSGTTLFAGTTDSRLVAYDVSTPVAPNQIASIPIAGPPVTMRISGTLMFVADGSQGLLIFDISKPNSPALLSQFSLSVPVWDSAPSGGTALLAADALGLVIVDVSNPLQVKQLSQERLPWFNPFPSYGTAGSVTLAISVAVQNGLGYVGTGTNDPYATDGLATFDVSQPTSPRLVGWRRQLLSTISVVTPSGSNLFLADGGLITEFDNSLPYDSIQLYEPPAALAQSFLTQGPQTAVYPKLASSRGKVRRYSPRKVFDPVCLVRSQCSRVE